MLLDSSVERGERISPTRIVLEAGRADSQYWQDLWRYRELFWFLAWRDVLVRYKQTVIGIAWALLGPFLTMLVLTIVFSRIAKVPAPGAAPYALLVMAGMLPWQLFSTALGEASNSLIGSANLISKIYFPRLIHSIHYARKREGYLEKDYLAPFTGKLVYVAFNNGPVDLSEILLPQETVADVVDEVTDDDPGLRPRTLDEFVGQAEIKEHLSIVLEAAAQRGQPADHLLLAGPPGLGKTTLAGIVAHEMEVGIQITSGPATDEVPDWRPA